jgi:MoaA/NifB/PqqE/SkfB family radical SAM enzyme
MERKKLTQSRPQSAPIIKKTVIITGYRCNNNCVFCANADKRHAIDKPRRQIMAEIQGARARGRDYLEIIGGETTIRQDLISIIQWAKKNGFERIAIATNGRMLSYANYVKEFLASGITDIIFSIHGHNAKLHDSLTRSEGSFDQLLQGIRNVKKMGFENLGSNTTIVKKNYRHLPEIGRFIYGLGIRNAEFIFVDPTRGGAYDEFSRIVPRISLAAPFIKKCLEIGKNKTLHWDIRYVPLCYFRGYLDQISEIKEKQTFQTEHLAPDFKNFDVENSRKEIGRIKTEACRRCSLYESCEGIWKEYYKRFGDRELRPLIE